jgi:hypothetical protein
VMVEILIFWAVGPFGRLAREPFYPSCRNLLSRASFSANYSDNYGYSVNIETAQVTFGHLIERPFSWHICSIFIACNKVRCGSLLRPKPEGMDGRVLHQSRQQNLD